jgi:predicted ATP-grasp superfamily ATP-dependent carboligase
MKILVLDGNENQAVACVRSLARAGHEVYVGAPARWSKAGFSRFASGRFYYADPQVDGHKYRHDVIAIVRRLGGALVLPMTEQATWFLSEARQEVFAVGGNLVLPKHEIVMRAFDKHAVTELARSLGIPVPKTALLRNDSDYQQGADTLAYPVVIKPRSSQQIRGRVSRTAGPPAYANNAKQFIAACSRMLSCSSELLVQEFVEGSGAGYFALVRHGTVRADFAHRRIRDVRPTGSGSALRVSVRPDERLKRMAVSLLEAIQWHGVAMVEFRVREDGTPVLLELNGRFWNSLPLAIYAGADFPALLAQMAETGDISTPPPYRAGVYCRWLLGDFRHLVEVWKGPPDGYPRKFPGPWATLGQFLRPVPGTFHDNFRIDDPLPEIGDWLDFLVRRVPGFLRRTRRTEGNAKC